MTEWLQTIANTPAVDELAARIERGGAVSARGAAGSSTIQLAAALRRRLNRPILLVVAHLDDADEALDELDALKINAAKLPAMEVVPGETSVNLELLAERLTLVRRLAEGDIPRVLVAPIQALMQAAPGSEALAEMLRIIRPGDEVALDELAGWLDRGGYRRVQTIETGGEFAIRGGIVDLFPPGGEPARIDLFGNEVEGLFAIDLDTMGSDRRLESLELVAATVDQIQTDQGTGSVIDYLPGAAATAVLAEVVEITEQGRSYFDRVSDARGIFGPPAVFQAIGQRCRSVVDVNQFASGSAPDALIELPVRVLPTFDEVVSRSVAELGELAGEAETVVLCQNEGEADRMRELLAEHAPGANIEVQTHYLHRGFIWDRGGGKRPIALVPNHELLHRYQTRRRIRRLAAGRTMDAFIDLQVGDFVVHRDHGIARFLGLRALDGVGGDSEEFLTLEFARGAKLNVPAARIDVVQKYIGAFTGTPELSTLGGKRWKRQKEKVSEAVRDLAAEMLRLQAARESQPGVRFPADTAWQHEFEAEFPYEETDDQLAAIAAVKRNMSDERPMDRLVCSTTHSRCFAARRP